jgi:hypothetical protein
MVRWEYCYVTYVSEIKLIGKAKFTVYIDGNKDAASDVIAVFKRLGSEGWEAAVGGLSIDAVASGAVWFKRPLTA